MLELLKQGVKGNFVTQWQVFLRGQGYPLNASDIFDDDTVHATQRFQNKHKLHPDGIVGNKTLGKAMFLGFEVVQFSRTQGGYPKEPPFAPLVDNAARQKMFGPLEFVPAPTSKNPEGIKITNDWNSRNLVRIVIPQLRGKEGASADGSVFFHRKAAEQLSALWEAFEKRGLLDLVLTYSGDYVPRFVRGKAAEQVLSNHAFGTAFDINYSWNKLGAEPATEGTQGCVYKLVPVAHEFGFYWGGHFTRRDGMHFEVAKVSGHAG